MTSRTRGAAATVLLVSVGALIACSLQGGSASADQGGTARGGLSPQAPRSYLAVPGATAPQATSNVNIVVNTPDGSPGTVILSGGQGERVVAKAPGAKTESFSIRLKPGRYRVLVRRVVHEGVLYVGTASLRQVVVKPKSVSKFSVDYAVQPGATSLKAVNVGESSVTLEWAAPPKGRVVVRRTEGYAYASGVRDGVGVPVSPGSTQVEDTNLESGQAYSYALFTVVRKKVTGPLTVTVGTQAPAGSGQPEFVARPGTIILTDEDNVAAIPTGSGVRWTLPTDQPPPAIGAAVAFPVTSLLEGGFLGVVQTISPDGRSVDLVAASLGEAFENYVLDVPHLVETFPLELTASGPSATDSVHPRALPSCLGLGAGYQVSLDPEIKLDGGAKYSIATSLWPLDRYAAARLESDFTVTLVAKADVEVTAAVSCALYSKRVSKQLTAAPVPINLVFEPSVTVSASGELKIEGAGVSASAGFSAGADFDTRRDDKVQLWGDPRFRAEPLTPTVTANGSVSLEVAGALSVGPGAGTDWAGVMAGLGGKLVLLEASIGPVFAPEDSRYNLCVRAGADWEVSAFITAKAWIPLLEYSTELPIPGLQKEGSYIDAWYMPADCASMDPPPDPGPDVTGPGIDLVDDESGGQSEQWTRVPGFVPGQVSWILSTGNASEVVGSPETFASTEIGGLGNSLLSDLAGFETYDAVYYRARVVPTGSTLHVRYVFASEEYPEYVGSEYNDVMGVFVNGVNCATVAGDPVAVNTINADRNSELFIDNSSGMSGYDTVMNGLTVPLTCSVTVAPGVPVDLEIAVADTSDGKYDTAVALIDGGIWST